VSLTVPASLAQRGAVSDYKFVDCIASRCPTRGRWLSDGRRSCRALVHRLYRIWRFRPDDAAWGEVFRLVGSDAMRGTVQKNLMRLPPGRFADLIQRNREAGTAQICRHTLACGEHPEVGEAGKPGRQDSFERAPMFPR
jgi:hypothetical protein